MLQASGLVPARFLVLTAHLVLTLAVLLARRDTVLACLPLDHSDLDMDRKDTELAAGLGVTIGLLAIEMVWEQDIQNIFKLYSLIAILYTQLGFLSGLSMFSAVQSLLSISLHAAASVAMAYLILDTWDCDLFWWIFSLCSVLPAISELTILVGVLGLKKHV